MELNESCMAPPVILLLITAQREEMGPFRKMFDQSSVAKSLEYRQENRDN